MRYLHIYIHKRLSGCFGVSSSSSSFSAYCRPTCNPNPGNKLHAEPKNINKDEVTKVLESRGEIWIDWKALIEPLGCYIHFDEIKMFYGQKKDLEKLPCCEGF